MRCNLHCDNCENALQQPSHAPRNALWQRKVMDPRSTNRISSNLRHANSQCNDKQSLNCSMNRLMSGLAVLACPLHLVRCHQRMTHEKPISQRTNELMQSSNLEDSNCSCRSSTMKTPNCSSNSCELRTLAANSCHLDCINATQQKERFALSRIILSPAFAQLTPCFLSTSGTSSFPKHSSH
jgi:hypothetical protein